MSLDLKRPEVVFTAKVPEKRGFSRSLWKMVGAFGEKRF